MLVQSSTLQHRQMCIRIHQSKNLDTQSCFQIVFSRVCLVSCDASSMYFAYASSFWTCTFLDIDYLMPNLGCKLLQTGTILPWLGIACGLSLLHVNYRLDLQCIALLTTITDSMISSLNRFVFIEWHQVCCNCGTNIVSTNSCAIDELRSNVAELGVHSLDSIQRWSPCLQAFMHPCLLVRVHAYFARNILHLLLYFSLNIRKRVSELARGVGPSSIAIVLNNICLQTLWRTRLAVASRISLEQSVSLVDLTFCISITACANLFDRYLLSCYDSDIFWLFCIRSCAFPCNTCRRLASLRALFW